MSILRSTGLLLLGLWLGAAIFFSVVVAPAAFSVLRSFQIPNATEVAGGIVNRSLAVVNTGGFVVSILLLLIVLALRSQFSKGSFLFELVVLIVLALATGVGQWIIAARMHAIRAALAVPMDQVAVNDPRRLAFNNLHQYSVSALAVGMIAALIAYVFLARSLRT